MADFGKKAFADAVEIAEEQEFQAYRKAVVGNFDSILNTAGSKAGYGVMNDLSRVVISNGCADTLADFISGIATICFHLGYEEGRLAE